MTVIGDPIVVRLSHYLNADATLQMRLVSLDTGLPAYDWDGAGVLQLTAAAAGPLWIYEATRGSIGLPAGTYQAQWRRSGAPSTVWIDDDEIILTTAPDPAGLLARVQERVETDLSTAELERLISEAQAAITARHGPPASVAAPITVTLDGQRRSLDVIRPIDTTQAVIVTEIPPSGAWDDPPVTLTAADYEILHGGRTLRRLGEWDPMLRWGYAVTVTYVPVDDSPLRDEVTIGLVQLAVERHGVQSRKAGDLAVETLDYVTEREKLLQTLAPRRGLFVR